jgi:large subunit ribosomal protein L23
MATKKTTTEEKKDVAIEKVIAKIVIAPHVTEKASFQSNVNAYTFLVAKNATKKTILDEIKKEYKVTPRAINITNTPRVKTFIRGKIGYKSGMKKAIVFLKKGDSITLS